jgi:hypothetical protein
MRLLNWGAVLPAFMVVAWMFLRRAFRRSFERMHVDHARELFHQQREWLEARFLKALSALDPEEGLRWEDAHWHDEVLWARDRQTRRLLALIGVHFDPDPFDDPLGANPRHATALFEFRKGAWTAEGKVLDELRPAEAVLRHRRFEPVVLHLRPGDSPSPR